MDLQKTLENYGLEAKEAKTYLTLLALGEVTATILAQKSNLDRTLMYQLTNKLIEKGLVSYIIKNNIRYFSAAPPETFLKNLQEKTTRNKVYTPGTEVALSYRKTRNKSRSLPWKEGN